MNINDHNDIKIGEVNFKSTFKIQQFNIFGKKILEETFKAPKGELFISLIIDIIETNKVNEFGSVEIDKIMSKLGYVKKENKKINISFNASFEKQLLDGDKIVLKMNFKAQKGFHFVTLLLGTVNKKEISKVNLEELINSSLGYSL